MCTVLDDDGEVQKIAGAHPAAHIITITSAIDSQLEECTDAANDATGNREFTRKKNKNRDRVYRLEPEHVLDTVQNLVATYAHFYHTRNTCPAPYFLCINCYSMTKHLTDL